MDTPRLTSPLKTVILGSGNVASAIGPALEAAGAIDVAAVYSPTMAHAEALAAKLSHASPIDSLAEMPVDASLYLVAVKDDAIAHIAQEAPVTPGALWLHTSGGVEASAMARLTDRYGVFYPLQTFTKGVPVDLSLVPIFIETAKPDDFSLVSALASAISPKVYPADGPIRAKMHAAAVFACNFSNHLWAIADDILRRETGTDLSVLHPLLKETLRKALEVPPADGQTGPAVRGDRGVIQKHASLLTTDEARLYNILSEHIINYYNKQS